MSTLSLPSLADDVTLGHVVLAFDLVLAMAVIADIGALPFYIVLSLILAGG